MDKPTTKKQNYNQDILKALSEKFGFSVDYIRKSLRGDRTGIMPDKIIAEYKILFKALDSTIINFKTQ